MEKLLIVDDDKGIQKQLKWSLSDYEAVLASDRESAVAAVRRYQPKVVTLDLGLPPDEANASEGLAALQEILAIAPYTKVIVITGNDDRTHALTAISLGAYDFYQKPIDTEVINIIVSRAFSVADIEIENRKMRSIAGGSDDGIIGSSESIDKLRMMIKRIAPTEITALVLGESGTGKEVTANAIHLCSDRKKNPFIAINCASIPEHLLESELFGFEKGAFTGAHRATKGKIECAEGGTLFLDEIGDMPYNLQAKLLRFLQEKSIERLGGRQEIPVNVRVVCATNQNLQEMVEAKTFREDLFYRVSEITLNIPPLREREDDVIILAKYFLKFYSSEYKSNVATFSEKAFSAIKKYSWPGNIRELQNKVKSAVVMATSRQIGASELGLSDYQDNKINEQSHTGVAVSLRIVRDQAEIGAIQKAYALSEGNMTKAAELLGVSRPTLYALIDKHELPINH